MDSKIVWSGYNVIITSDIWYYDKYNLYLVVSTLSLKRIVEYKRLINVRVYTQTWAEVTHIVNST